MFRRRPVELVEEPATEEQPARQPAADEEPPPSPRGHTPSKRELGRVTPKRPTARVRRPGATTSVRSRKLTKEEKQQLRQEKRERRREISDGMRHGDPRYLPARDQGPERAVVRDVVDARRTVGTWFFGGALVILILSSTTIPEVVTAANALFILLTVAVTIDSVVICRRVKSLVRQRCPDSTQRMGGLYFYAVLRAITFRRMRIPLPRLNFGDPV
jgi:hypothetical protein